MASLQELLNAQNAAADRGRAGAWSERNKQAFGGLLDINQYLPVTGDIQSGILAAQDVGQGKYGSAALNALGLLPFVPALGGTIKKAGKAAKTDYEIAMDAAQKNAALPISKGGLGLPANNTAMDRAKALGFDVNAPLFHGTNKEFSAFDVNAGRGKGFNTGANLSDNPYLANTYATGEGKNVMPLMVRDNPAMNVEAAGANWNRLTKSTKLKTPTINVLDQDAELLKQLGLFPETEAIPTIAKQGYSKTLNTMFPNEFLFDDYFSTDDLARFARNEGYDSVKFNNIVDIGPSGMMVTEKSGLPSNNQVIFNPALIRSRFAAFDPFRRNEPDLLAGIGGASLAGLLGLSLLDQQQYD
jgi:hypothetical protein